MRPFDVDALRARFPALALEHEGRPMAFFDGPGGTQVTDTVIAAVSDYFRTSNANHGGTFPTSERSDAILDEAPGLGVSVDEKQLTFIEAMTEAAQGPTHRRPDGSLTHW